MQVCSHVEARGQPLLRVLGCCPPCLKTGCLGRLGQLVSFRDVALSSPRAVTTDVSLHAWLIFLCNMGSGTVTWVFMFAGRACYNAVISPPCPQPQVIFAYTYLLNLLDFLLLLF